MKQSLSIIILLQLCIISQAMAENTQKPAVSSENAELTELINLLQEETSIITKSRVNSDYVPGMLTVLQGSEMQTLGKLTVWDALSLVPGLKTLKTENGTPMVITRGIPNPFNSGNIKILLNSVTMSSEVSGMNSALLLLPIEQVERIEFIRGPSSSIYGNSAYMGLINIITIKGKQEFGLLGQSGELIRANGSAYWTDKENELHLNTNFSIQNDQDEMTRPQTQASSELKSLLIQLDYKNTALSSQFFEREYIQNNRFIKDFESKEQDFSLALEHKFSVTEKLNSKLSLSYVDNQFDDNKTYQGSVTSAQWDNHLELFNNHQLLFSFATDNYQIDQASLCSNRPILGILKCSNNIRNDQSLTDSWNNFRLSLQDQYAINDKLMLTAGVGIAYNDNIDETTIAPRLALVWQVSDQHLLKAQYSKGYRAPTYFELYDTKGRKNDLQSEQIESVELGYIYKYHHSLARITLFHSRLHDLIHPTNVIAYVQPMAPTYINQSQAKTSGIELEWEQRINRQFKWGFNLSYADAQGTRNSFKKYTAPAGSSDWLGNITAQYQPNKQLVYALHYYHVGKQSINNNTIDGYQKLDLSLNWSAIFNKQTILRLGINNLLDDEILYFDTQPSTVDAVQYEGRSFWLQLSYKY